ncbi:MAG TPA: SUMF1/EgtB/PvdO family nonheme iron enzyme [Polyangiaceae bacterium]|nr:SUMF1/EgtB/PvdO family nonheme iron enzyme [Polyangiaceae bacterium]
MVAVRDFCIDRFEVRTVDARTHSALSPYYPPDAKLVASIFDGWQLEKLRVGTNSAREMPLPEVPWVQRSRSDYVPRAVSEAGVVPQGYLSYWLAKKACENAAKRLCTENEWVTACKGQSGAKFPYGSSYDPNACNVYRAVHPATALHGAAFYGHRDPRLNLVSEPSGAPLLRLTGSSPACRSRFGDDAVFDMVGNLDEWVEASPTSETSSGSSAKAVSSRGRGHSSQRHAAARGGRLLQGAGPSTAGPSAAGSPAPNIGAFLGGFYARATREGCEARVGSHAPAYYDYSTGTRCCRAQGEQ